MDAVGANRARPAGIALIGMSGAGKSHLTRALAECGYPHVFIDQVIAGRLNAEDALGLRSLQAVAEWMGFPDSPTYAARSRRYQLYEADAVRDVVERLESGSEDPTTLIIDTTGSVIYLNDDLLERFRRVSTMVHLATPPEVRERMLSEFRITPTPLIWGDGFDYRVGEPVHDALVRSYLPLVEQREAEYSRRGHVRLSYGERHDPDFDIATYLKTQGLLD